MPQNGSHCSLVLVNSVHFGPFAQFGLVSEQVSFVECHRLTFEFEVVVSRLKTVCSCLNGGVRALHVRVCTGKTGARALNLQLLAVKRNQPNKHTMPVEFNNQPAGTVNGLKIITIPRPPPPPSKNQQKNPTKPPNNNNNQQPRNKNSALLIVLTSSLNISVQLVVNSFDIHSQHIC